MLSWVTGASMSPESPVIESSRTESDPHIGSSTAPTLWSEHTFEQCSPQILVSCDGRSIVASAVLQTVEPVDLIFCRLFFLEAQWQREHSQCTYAGYFLSSRNHVEQR